MDDAIDHYVGIAGKDLRTFATGGDAAWLQTHCRNGMEIVPALVLEGVNALGGESPGGGIPQ